MAEIKGTNRVVRVEALRENPWNPNVQSDFMFAKARASIVEFGFVDPVTVFRIVGEEGYTIVDGAHRWRAAKLEGLTEVPVWDLGEVPRHVAQRLTIVMNEGGGQPDQLKLSELVHEISQQGEELVGVLPYTNEEIVRMLDIATFDLSKMDGTGSPDPNAPPPAQDPPESPTSSFAAPPGGVLEQAITIAKMPPFNAKDDDAALVLICEFFINEVGVAGQDALEVADGGEE